MAAKLKFLHGIFLEVQGEVTDWHEQLMEELASDEPLFNDDWIYSSYICQYNG